MAQTRPHKQCQICSQQPDRLRPGEGQIIWPRDHPLLGVNFASKSLENRLLSIDELDHGIVNLAARINTATYELLVLVRQFDERAGWLQWGLSNCAEWLHYRCDQ